MLQNYRPVSVLNAMSKILERIMYDRLVTYIEKLDLMYNKQYGFRKGHSTDHAIIDVVDSVLKTLDNNEVAVAVFMDLAKAFDTINHGILLEKLNHYGVHGNAFCWFKSYLTNRKQMVKYNRTVSNEDVLVCGVPQGSILGPILFLLYINDLSNVSTMLKAVLFADDTNLFINGNCLDETIVKLNQELNNISIWFQCNQLSQKN